jgi:hypothetical protein
VFDAVADGDRRDAELDPEHELRDEPEGEDRPRDDDQAGQQHTGVEHRHI